MADPFDVGRLEGDLHTKGQHRQQGELVGSVDAVEVKARVGLSQALLLGTSQHGVKLLALLAHRCENVITGAIDDTEEGAVAIRSQTLTQSAGDRDPAGHARLEPATAT